MKVLFGIVFISLMAVTNCQAPTAAQIPCIKRNLNEVKFVASFGGKEYRGCGIVNDESYNDIVSITVQPNLDCPNTSVRENLFCVTDE